MNCARELAVRCTDVTSVGGPRWQRRHAQIRPRGKVPSGRAPRLETDYPAQQVRLQVVRRQVERQRCVAARAVPESISVRAAIGAILPRYKISSSAKFLSSGAAGGRKLSCTKSVRYSSRTNGRRLRCEVRLCHRQERDHAVLYFCYRITRTVEPICPQL